MPLRKLGGNLALRTSASNPRERRVPGMTKLTYSVEGIAGIALVTTRLEVRLTLVLWQNPNVFL